MVSEAQFLAHDVQLLGIFGVAHPGDGVDAGFSFLAVRQHRRLISSALVAAISSSASFTLACRSAFQGGRVALHRHYVVEVHVGPQYVGVGIDDGHVVAPLQQLPVRAMPTLPSPAIMIFMPGTPCFCDGKTGPAARTKHSAPAAPRDLRRALTYTITAQRKRSK